MLRGTGSGLEFVFSGGEFAEEAEDAFARLAERPEFYRGSQATLVLETPPGSASEFQAFRERLAACDVALRGVFGDENVASFAREFDLAYLGHATPRATVARIDRNRERRAAIELSESARSLDADFAGARAELAKRRIERATRPAAAPAAVRPVQVAPIAAVAAIPVPGTLYHRGTLRGGQSLQQMGNIVVVGDVNPGAELVATGDIVVVGALRGTAHAGAQGDTSARVIALELAPTQLRIASYIAADSAARGTARGPEEAFVDGDRIAVGHIGKAGR
jgi:septum site-determining protein MinC